MLATNLSYLVTIMGNVLMCYSTGYFYMILSSFIFPSKTFDECFQISPFPIDKILKFLQVSSLKIINLVELDKSSWENEQMLRYFFQAEQVLFAKQVQVWELARTRIQDFLNFQIRFCMICKVWNQSILHLIHMAKRTTKGARRKKNRKGYPIEPHTVWKTKYWFLIFNHEWSFMNLLPDTSYDLITLSLRNLNNSQLY